MLRKALRSFLNRKEDENLNRIVGRIMVAATLKPRAVNAKQVNKVSDKLIT